MSSGTETRKRYIPVLVRVNAEEFNHLERLASRYQCTRQDAIRSVVARAAEQLGGSGGQVPLTSVAALVPRLVGSKEIGVLFARGGVPLTKQQSHALTKRPGFPEPVARLGAGPVWVEQDVLDWAADNG